jgi:hypothetical protein
MGGLLLRSGVVGQEKTLGVGGVLGQEARAARLPGEAGVRAIDADEVGEVLPAVMADDLEQGDGDEGGGEEEPQRLDEAARVGRRDPGQGVGTEVARGVGVAPNAVLREGAGQGERSSGRPGVATGLLRSGAPPAPERRAKVA